MKRLLPIVEGQADVKAVPRLIEKVLKTHQRYGIKVLPAQRRGEYPTVARSFGNYFRAALKENAAILWVMDFDSDECLCPFEQARSLLSQAEQLRPDWPLKVAFMVKEYETLFLADEQATRSVLPRLDARAAFPQDPESIRGAKQWLSKRLPLGQAYKEMVHQDKITAALDLERLRTYSPSFSHFERAVLALAGANFPMTHPASILR
jgi:hypothetical protein